MRPSWFFSALLLAACYQPDYSAPHYRCGPDGTCPEGYFCQADLCQVDRPAGDMPVPDMQKQAQDLVASLPPPDMSANPPPAPGCTKGGSEIIKKGLYACLGAFTNNHDSQGALCQHGFHVCEGSSMDDMLLTEKAAADCAKIPGFYILRHKVVLDQDGMGNFVLDCAAKFGVPALLGCGAQDGALLVMPPCNGLSQTLSCVAQIKGWTCGQNGIDDVIHSVASPGGILCCKD